MLATQTLSVGAAARLDRLPVFSFHRRIMVLLGFCFFFELGDINTFSFAAPAIRAQWGLSITAIGAITSATFLGMFVGACFGGRFSDRFGRKRALIVTTVGFSVASLLNALAWEPASLFAARLLTGIGLSAMTAVGITYVAEMFPAKIRGAYQGWALMIGLCGIPATAFVARFLVPAFPEGWRLVFVWGALGLVFPLFATALEESPRWYERRGRLADAEAVLDRIEKMAAAEKGPLPALLPAPPETPPLKGAFGELFAARVRPRTFMLIGAWIFQTLGFYGFAAWVPTLLVAHGFKLVDSLVWSSAMQLGGIPGALIAALLSDRWERKGWITISALLIALCGLIYGLTFETFYIVVFGFLVTMFLQTFAPVLYAYTAECFPTEIRSSGTGLTYGIGRLANALGPLLIAFLFTGYGYRSVFIYIAACWVMMALIVGVFGPRTHGRML
jgi:putative MFS transporter